MDEEPYQVLHIFDSREGFEDTQLPSCKLSWRVDVMRLLIGREVLLRPGVEFNHGLGQRLGVALDGWPLREHCLVESTVDLLQRVWAWEIYEDQRGVSKESFRQDLSSGISWRVTSSYELDSLKSDKLLV